MSKFWIVLLLLNIVFVLAGSWFNVIGLTVSVIMIILSRWNDNDTWQAYLNDEIDYFHR